MNVDDMIEVLQAYKEGKTIEVASKGRDDWESTMNPHWEFRSFDYRVKQELKTIWLNYGNLFVHKHKPEKLLGYEEYIELTDDVKQKLGIE